MKDLHKKKIGKKNKKIKIIKMIMSQVKWIKKSMKNSWTKLKTKIYWKMRMKMMNLNKKKRITSLKKIKMNKALVMKLKMSLKLWNME